MADAVKACIVMQEVFSGELHGARRLEGRATPIAQAMEAVLAVFDAG